MKNISETSAYKWWVLVAVQCVLFLFGVDSTIVNLALPTITTDLHIDVVLTQWIISIFLISIAVALPLSGRLADIFGRKKIFVGGLITLTISSFFAAISSSFACLIIMRVLQGLGCAACLANCNAIITTVFPPHRHGLALGINNTVFSIGIAIGVLGGGFLIEFFHWRSIFFINALFGVLFTLISSIVLIEEKISKHVKTKPAFDFFGSSLLVLMLGGIMSGVIFYLNPTDVQHLPFFLVLGGIFSFLFFIFAELRSSSPLLDLKLYKIHAFAAGNLIRILITMVPSSVLFMIPFYAQESLNFSPLQSGLILLPFTLGLLFFGPIGGHLGDKFGARITTFFGFLIIAFSLVLLITLNEYDQQKSLFLILMKLATGLFLIGIGIGLTSGPNNSATLQTVPHSEKAVSAGLLYTIGFLSEAFSTAIGSGMIHKASMLFTQTSIAVLHAKTNVFYILLTLTALGAALCYFRPKNPVST